MMPEQKSTLVALREWLALSAAAIAVLLVVWRGGEFSACMAIVVRDLSTLTHRVEVLETGKTAGAAAYIERDEERTRTMQQTMANLQTQVNEVQRAIVTLSEVKGEIKAMNVKLDSLVNAFDEHRKGEKKP
jgi:hypothetical protein